MVHKNSSSFQTAALTIDIFGIVSNLLLFIFLQFNNVGSRLTNALMKNQFMFDALASACAASSLLISEDFEDFTSSYAQIFCHAWVSRAVFWFVVLLSEANLMCITVDRMRAVVFPSNYYHRRGAALAQYVLFVLVYAIVISVPSSFLVQFTGSQCYHKLEYYAPGSFRHYSLFFSYFWLVFGYLFPGLVMGASLYKLFATVKKMWDKKANMITLTCTHCVTHHQETAHIHLRFEKTIATPAVFMCAVFLITHSYQVIYMILCAHRVIQFDALSVERRLGILLTVVNSSFNPLILVISSPPFRRSLIQFLRTCKCPKPTSGGSEDQSCNHCLPELPPQSD
ncbi:unnamed protein product [Calicophoron daubneyi]|uniref:G-protein coupled receptors family 1 profile domain-containing protein n=1 Tax=Calicophoron daubneyi TaxID=300641 RepID=A0AAV2T6J3_CALDB